MSDLEQYEEVVRLRAQIAELRDLFKSSSDALWSSYSAQKKRIEELEDQISALQSDRKRDLEHVHKGLTPIKPWTDVSADGIDALRRWLTTRISMIEGNTNG